MLRMPSAAPHPPDYQPSQLNQLIRKTGCRHNSQHAAPTPAILTRTKNDYAHRLLAACVRTGGLPLAGGVFVWVFCSGDAGTARGPASVNHYGFGGRFFSHWPASAVPLCFTAGCQPVCGSLKMFRHDAAILITMLFIFSSVSNIASIKIITDLLS